MTIEIGDLWLPTSLSSLLREAPVSSGGVENESVRRSEPAGADDDVPDPTGLPGRWGRLPRAWLGLLGAAVVLWVVSALRTQVGTGGEWGLLAEMPLSWFASIACVAAAFVVGLRHERDGELLLAVPVLLLVVAIHATPAVLYDGPRYFWTGKHYGVVEYILANGRVNPEIDVYHAWPGFFAFGAWILAVAGIDDPASLARWWPVMIEVAVVLSVRFALAPFTLQPRRLWMATLTFALANWFGLSYFAPQSVGLVLAYFLVGVTVRWLCDSERVLVQPRDRSIVWQHAEEAPKSAPAWAIGSVVIAFAVVVPTHQFTPYLILTVFGVAVFFLGLKPRPLPLVLGGVAFTWLIVQFDQFRQNSKLPSLDTIFDNLRPPTVRTAYLEVGPVVVLNRTSINLLMGLVVVTAGVGVLCLWRARVRAVHLVVLAASPIAPVIVNGYGNEGILRAILFALPWLSLLVTYAVWPPRRNAADEPRKVGRAAVWVAMVLPLFLSSFFLLDDVYRPRVADLHAARWFEENAPAGSLLVQLGLPNQPGRVTARYPELRFASRDSLVGTPNRPDGAYDGTRDLRIFTDQLLERIDNAPEYYVSISESIVERSAIYGFSSREEMGELQDALARSSQWELVYSEPGADLYRYVERPPKR